MKNHILFTCFRLIVFLMAGMLGALTMPKSLAWSQATLALNYTIDLAWNDYQKTTYQLDASVFGAGYPSCACKCSIQAQTYHIPFAQSVTLTPSRSASDTECEPSTVSCPPQPPNNPAECDGAGVRYRLAGGNWTEIGAPISFQYVGALDVQVTAKATNMASGSCLSLFPFVDRTTRRCTLNAAITFYADNALKAQAQQLGPYTAVIPVTPGKKELLRIPAPTSQFYDGNMQSNGAIDNLTCQVTTDKLAETMTTCEREGAHLVIYTRPKAPGAIEFNYTTLISWKYYKQTTHEYRAGIYGTGWPSCAPGIFTSISTQAIPFAQEILLKQTSSSDPAGQCAETRTRYRQTGGDWVEFAPETRIVYGGNLDFEVSGKTGSGWGDGCASFCEVILTATFYDETSNSLQSQEGGPHAVIIPGTAGKKELTRIPVPQSQTNDVVIRDTACQVTTDKPANVTVSCEQQGGEFIVYAQPK